MYKFRILLIVVFTLGHYSAIAQFCDFPIGFGRNTTGGAGGAIYTVTNLNNDGPGSLRAGLESGERLIIRFSVTGTINLNADINVRSNKTVDGAGNYIRIRPYGFRINRQSNIIIRNLHFQSDGQVHSGGTGDAITIQNETTNIWIDHCSFENYEDGLIDIIRESDHITVSWCYFRTHQKVMLIGHSDDHTVDAGKLNVTVHHNFYDGTTQRHPRIRFGRAHVFNNFLRNISEMGMASGTDAQMVIENNRFENVVKPAVLQYDSNWRGYITESGNQRINTAALQTRPPTFNPSSIYSYALEPADNTLRDFLVAYTGHNKTTGMSLSVSGNTMTANYLARSFQWYRDGQLIPGATSNNFTATVCGNYSIRLFGDQGCYKELQHTVTDALPAAPMISVPNGNTFFCTDGSVTLRATEAPDGFGYQWSRDGEHIDGAVSREYVANIQGAYQVRFTGVCESANSESVFLEDRGAPDCDQVCGGNAQTDCNGNCNGTAIPDDCGVCLEPESVDFNATCTGCDGVVNSGFEIDSCGRCLHPDNVLFNNCTPTAISYHFAGDGIKVQVYPNPFYDRLTVCVEDAATGDLLVELFTMHGQKVAASSIYSKCTELINPPVAEGMYMLQIRHNERLLFSGRVVKQ